MNIRLIASAADRRLLDEGKNTRSMTWIMAIMLFLTVLAAALGLGMIRAGDALGKQLAGRLTVQIVEADARKRDAATRAVVAQLNATKGVAKVAEVDRARLVRLLRPWLGDNGADPDLPVPAMIDVDLSDASDGAVTRLESALRGTFANIRVDRHAAWMSPVAGFIGTLGWLAAALVALMALATGAVVLLAARAGLDTHRDTISVLHMLGSTDVQVARLFQRRIALDTLFGGLIGAALAGGTVVFLGWRAATLGSDLASGVSLGQTDWLLLAALPFAFALLATLAARRTVLAALRRVL